MRLGVHLALGTSLTVALLTACSDGPLLPAPSTGALAARTAGAEHSAITLHRSGPRFRRFGDYLTAFRQAARERAEWRRAASGDTGSVSLLTCGGGGGWDDMAAPVDGEVAPSGSFTTMDGFTLGAVVVWGRPDPFYGNPQFALGYQIPRRFLEETCGEWRYGSYSDGEYGANTADNGTEPTGEYDGPSPDPDIISDAEWSELNPRERWLAMKEWAKSPAHFAEFIAKMKAARADAEQWAQSVEPFGAHNGPQDAMRHAYWQCALTRSINSQTAKDWGDAHEAFSLASDEVRMDLANNAQGRWVALNATMTCADGVLWLRNQGRLVLAPLPPPTAPSSASPMPTVPLDS